LWIGHHGSFLPWVSWGLQAKVGFSKSSQFKSIEKFFPKQSPIVSTGALLCFLGPLLGKVFNSLGTVSYADQQAVTDAIVSGECARPHPIFYFIIIQFSL
jgi:hypothetical protein